MRTNNVPPRHAHSQGDANSTIVKVGRMPEAAAAKVKDSSRFTSDSDPQVHRPAPEADHTFVSPKSPRPAKGEDLQTPFASHGAGPEAAAKDAGLKLPPSILGMGQPSIVKLPELKLPVVVPKEYLSSLIQTQLPVPSGKAQGKPKPEAANSYVTWADLIAADRPSRNSPRSSETQAPPKRVRFADQAETRKFPIREAFQPGEHYSGSPHDVSFGPKREPGEYRRWKNPEAIPMKPRRETQGQDAPHILDNPSYPPPPPPKGIMTNHTPGPIKTPFLNIGAKKAVLGGTAALVTGAAVGGMIVAGLTAGSKEEDASSNTPNQT